MLRAGSSRAQRKREKHITIPAWKVKSVDRTEAQERKKYRAIARVARKKEKSNG